MERQDRHGSQQPPGALHGAGLSAALLQTSYWRYGIAGGNSQIAEVDKQPGLGNDYVGKQTV
jgi:hypothetical protein